MPIDDPCSPPRSCCQMPKLPNAGAVRGSGCRRPITPVQRLGSVPKKTPLFTGLNTLLENNLRRISTSTSTSNEGSLQGEYSDHEHIDEGFSGTHDQGIWYKTYRVTATDGLIALCLVQPCSLCVILGRHAEWEAPSIPIAAFSLFGATKGCTIGLFVSVFEFFHCWSPTIRGNGQPP
jgi:hypothetical protein